MSNPPRRFTDATFISLLEKLGIGRPSTYSSIIETIKDRGYAEVRDCEGSKMNLTVQTHRRRGSPQTRVVETDWGRESRRLVLTDLGSAVCAFMYPLMESVLGISMTANMEDTLDQISRGTVSYESSMKQYWNSIQTLLASLPAKKKNPTKTIIGTQTIDGVTYDITFETTRYGPAIVRSNANTPHKEYGNVPKGVNVSDLTLEQAVRYLPTSFGSWKK